MARHPPRLANAVYVGIQRYFLTICCAGRRRWFLDGGAQDVAVSQLRHTMDAAGFAVCAYCLMPDHLHAVLEADRDDAEFREATRLYKQRTAYGWKRETGEVLWQRSFHDHVLRDQESTQRIVRYVLENPVRARLVTAPADYPYAGSFVYSRDEL